MHGVGLWQRVAVQSRTTRPRYRVAASVSVHTVFHAWSCVHSLPSTGMCNHTQHAAAAAPLTAHAIHGTESLGHSGTHSTNPAHPHPPSPPRPPSHCLKSRDRRVPRGTSTHDPTCHPPCRPPRRLLLCPRACMAGKSNVLPKTYVLHSGSGLFIFSLAEALCCQ